MCNDYAEHLMLSAQHWTLSLEARHAKLTLRAVLAHVQCLCRMWPSLRPKQMPQ